MNIFAVDRDPHLAARNLHDRHVVKMSLETAQILCTVAHQLGIPAPYKPTHAHHPSVRWAGESSGNAAWLTLHGMELCKEYTRRFGRVHKCEAIIHSVGFDVWLESPLGRLTPFAQAMPDEFRDDDAIQAYRRYYRAKKIAGNRWTNSAMPDWAKGE